MTFNLATPPYSYRMLNGDLTPEARQYRSHVATQLRGFMRIPGTVKLHIVSDANEKYDDLLIDAVTDALTFAGVIQQVAASTVEQREWAGTGQRVDVTVSVIP